jgi:hypothetical protein
MFMGSIKEQWLAEQEYKRDKNIGRYFRNIRMWN